MGIDITITATQRPAILERTLKSFYYHMLRPKMNLIQNVFVNIDPVGPGTLNETKAVLQKYFSSSKLQITMPKTPGFGKAFVSVWRQAAWSDSACVFHLEDDWELLKEVDLQKMFLLLYLYPELSVLRLSAFSSGTHIMKCWDKLLNWNGTFFEVPHRLRGLLGFCGHPSLIRKDFVRQVIPYIDEGKNPEKQIKDSNPQIKDYINNHRYGVFQEQDAPATIRDIGRKWMTKTGYRKAGSKAWFTQWEEVKS